MGNDPYKILGVSESATQDEIRAAYLQLVKKYHPDKYTDPDLKKVANARIVEINEAYETLTKKSASSSVGGGGRYDGGSTYSGPNAAEFSRVRSLMNVNNLEAAKVILDSIAVHNAEWYYLYGAIYLRQGWYDKAREYLTKAHNQEPGNAEYANAYNTVRMNSKPYARRAKNHGADGCSSCDICSGLMCTDCCCECLGGDFIRCC